MEKKAFFMKGNPSIRDNHYKSQKSFDRDINIMRDIVKYNGYSIEDVNSINLTEKLGSYQGGDFLFYYVGHANNGSFERNNINDIITKLEGKIGNKKIILDACAGGDKIRNLSLPEKSQIITANEVFSNCSLAMILWDYIYAYKKEFESLNKETFDSMKHNWVYFREN